MKLLLIILFPLFGFQPPKKKNTIKLYHQHTVSGPQKWKLKEKMSKEDSVIAKRIFKGKI